MFSLASCVSACEPLLLSGIVSSSVISLVSVPHPQVLHCDDVRARKVLQITHFPFPRALSCPAVAWSILWPRWLLPRWSSRHLPSLAVYAPGSLQSLHFKSGFPLQAFGPSCRGSGCGGGGAWGSFWCGGPISCGLPLWLLPWVSSLGGSCVLSFSVPACVWASFALSVCCCCCCLVGPGLRGGPGHSGTSGQGAFAGPGTTGPSCC